MVHSRSIVIGIAGPISIRSLASYLGFSGPVDSLPKGLGGSPVTLLTEELLRRGRRIVVFTLDPDVDHETALVGRSLRILVGPFRRRPRDRALDLFRRERAYIEHAIRAERPDIVHAHWTYEYALGATASGVPHLITAHDAPLSVLWWTRDAYRLIRTVMAYRAVWSAKSLSAVSPYVAQHLRTFFGYRAPITIVQNGLPEESFAVTSSERPDRGGTSFGTVLQGWTKFKNGPAAIMAFHLARKKAPAAQLVMFGDGYGPGQDAQWWAEQQGIAEGVKFAGAVPRDELMSRLRNEIDVLVHPSLEEAASMTITEAMAMRIPIIAGIDSGGVPWMLDYGRAGVLVDVRDPAEIARAMVRLAEDRDLRAQYSTAAYQEARSRFSISGAADGYERLYRAILQFD